LTGYLADRSEKIGGRVRDWLKIPPPKTPDTAATRNPAAPAVPNTPPGTPVTPTERPPAIGADGLIGRLDIPRLHLQAIVREGVGEDTLSVALGHIPSTAFPGQNGNVGVAGHRDKLFRGLRAIRKDDLIRLETLGKNYEYRVESTKIVKPSDVSVLNAAAYPELTLVTCYPFYYVGS